LVVPHVRDRFESPYPSLADRGSNLSFVTKPGPTVRRSKWAAATFASLEPPRVRRTCRPA
jgi:hypothetical protein